MFYLIPVKISYLKGLGQLLKATEIYFFILRILIYVDHTTKNLLRISLSQNKFRKEVLNAIGERILDFISEKISGELRKGKFTDEDLAL